MADEDVAALVVDNGSGMCKGDYLHPFFKGHFIKKSATRRIKSFQKISFNFLISLRSILYFLGRIENKLYRYFWIVGCLFLDRIKHKCSSCTKSNSLLLPFSNWKSSPPDVVYEGNSKNSLQILTSYHFSLQPVLLGTMPHVLSSPPLWVDPATKV